MPLKGLWTKGWQKAFRSEVLYIGKKSGDGRLDLFGPSL